MLKLKEQFLNSFAGSIIFNSCIASYTFITAVLCYQYALFLSIYTPIKILHKYFIVDNRVPFYL